MRVRAVPEAKAPLLVAVQHPELPPPQSLPSPSPILVSPSIPKAASRAGPLLLPARGERGIKEFLEKHFSASPKKRKRNLGSKMPLPSGEQSLPPKDSPKIRARYGQRGHLLLARWLRARRKEASPGMVTCRDLYFNSSL